MTSFGEILDITENDYHLVVVGARWVLVHLSSGDVVAQDGCNTHAAAKQAALMAARIYVPDFYVSEEHFLGWFMDHEQQVVDAFLTSLPDDKIGNFNHEDLVAYARDQYGREFGECRLNGKS
jgi:hypothetical protein